jgi:hypothetical protein
VKNLDYTVTMVKAGLYQIMRSHELVGQIKLVYDRTRVKWVVYGRPIHEKVWEVTWYDVFDIVNSNAFPRPDEKFRVLADFVEKYNITNYPGPMGFFKRK